MAWEWPGSGVQCQETRQLHLFWSGLLVITQVEGEEEEEEEEEEEQHYSHALRHRQLWKQKNIVTAG